MQSRAPLQHICRHRLTPEIVCDTLYKSARMRTRNKKSTKAQPAPSGVNVSESDQPSQLSQCTGVPPRLCVLPKGLSDHARIISLPRKLSMARYVLCPERGCFEFTTVGGDKTCQSWLVTSPNLGEVEPHVEEEAYILREPRLLVATPIDPLFLILPMMAAADAKCPGVFRTITDILYDEATTRWQALRQLLVDSQWHSIVQQLEMAVAEVSELLSLGDEEDATYRLSSSKLAACLLQKAIRAAEESFPASLEERFVKQAVELPICDVVVYQDAIESNDSRGSTHPTDASEDTLDSRTTAGPGTTAAASVADPTSSRIEPTENLNSLLRVRTTFDFMLRSYIPPGLHQQINDALSELNGILDFAPLVKYEAQLASRRTELQALRTLSDNISRKRKLEDEEAADKAEEKRRRKEEEEARKKSVSHGVKKLMKADTSGMKKLSSFFTRKLAA